MATISREAVTKAITEHIRNYLASIEQYEKRPEIPPEQIEKAAEGVFALMRLADELGLYEDVESHIVIPYRFKEELFGSPEA